MFDPAQIKYFENMQELSKAAAEKFFNAAQAAIRQRNVFTVALAGGSTPSQTYAYIAEHFSETLDWSKVHFFWGDERMVPMSDPQSNYFNAYQQLLSKIIIPEGNIHAIQTEHDPEIAAAAYEEEIYALFKSYGLLKKAGVDDFLPGFDFIFLGLGADGHVASLFPGTKALTEQNALVAANAVPQLQTVRITLTFKVINAADLVLFLVGSAKREIVRRIFDPADAAPLPAKMVWNEQAEWYIEGPAELLPQEE